MPRAGSVMRRRDNGHASDTVILLASLAHAGSDDAIVSPRWANVRLTEHTHRKLELVNHITHTHTHTQPFNGLWSRTTGYYDP